VKIEPRQVEAFLKKPDPKIRGVVIYGNDDGLVAERAMTLAKTVCDDLKDPFRVVDIAGDVLKNDPARLADEFGAMSLMGGRRVIRVRPAGEETTTALENLVEAATSRRARACAPWPRPRPAWRRCRATWTTRQRSRACWKARRAPRA
jgi:DNA polymerase-3 subunit delta